MTEKEGKKTVCVRGFGSCPKKTKIASLRARGMLFALIPLNAALAHAAAPLQLMGLPPLSLRPCPLLLLLPRLAC